MDSSRRGKEGVMQASIRPLSRDSPWHARNRRRYLTYVSSFPLSSVTKKQGQVTSLASNWIFFASITKFRFDSTRCKVLAWVLRYYDGCFKGKGMSFLFYYSIYFHLFYFSFMRENEAARSFFAGWAMQAFDWEGTYIGYGYLWCKSQYVIDSIDLSQILWPL